MNYLRISFFALVFIFSSLTHADPLTALGRLDLMKELYTVYPDLKIDTKVPEIFEKLYTPDIDFVTACAETDMQHSKIDQIKTVVRSVFEDQLSLQDYNVIGLLLTHIFDMNDQGSTLSIREEFQKYAFSVSLQKSTKSERYNFIGSPYMPVPVVSKTGEVPILVMNKGWGFMVNGKPRSVDFLAVPTNKKNNFDTFRDRPSRDAYIHDNAHLQLAGRLLPEYDQDIYAARITRIAALREQIEAIPDAQDYLDAELAFFDHFHEKFKENIDHEVGEQILNAEKKAHSFDEDACPNFIKLQLESYLLASAELGIDFSNETRTFQGLVRAYYCHLARGYRILSGFAEIYNAATPPYKMPSRVTLYAQEMMQDDKAITKDGSLDLFARQPSQKIGNMSLLEDSKIHTKIHMSESEEAILKVNLTKDNIKNYFTDLLLIYSYISQKEELLNLIEQLKRKKNQRDRKAYRFMRRFIGGPGSCLDFLIESEDVTWETFGLVVSSEVKKR